MSVRTAILGRGPRIPNIAARLEVLTGLRTLRAASVRRRYGPQLARFVPDGLVIADVRMTVNGVALADAGPPGEPPTVIVKLGTGEGSDGILRRAIDAVTAIAADPRFAGWRLGPPAIHGHGESDGHPWMVESVLRGAPADELIAGGGDRPAIEAIALAEIEAFHACTARAAIVDDELLRRWVDEPAARVLTLVSDSPARVRALEDLGHRLRAELGGLELATGWVHGDFSPDNVLMNAQGSEVDGIVDWELAAPDALCCLDQVLFLLTVHTRLVHRELGQVVASFVTEPIPEPLAGSVAEVCHSQHPADPLDPRSLVLLCWLQHVAATTLKSPTRANHPIWGRYNVRSVLDALASLGPAC